MCCSSVFRWYLSCLSAALACLPSLAPPWPPPLPPSPASVCWYEFYSMLFLFFFYFFCLILDMGILLVYLHLGLVVFYSLHCFWGFIPTLFLQETDPMSFIILSQTAHLSLDISCHHLCQKNQLKGIFLVYYYLFFHFATSFLLLCSSNNINGYIRTLVSTQTCHVTHHSILSS